MLAIIGIGLLLKNLFAEHSKTVPAPPKAQNSTRFPDRSPVPVPSVVLPTLRDEDSVFHVDPTALIQASDTLRRGRIVQDAGSGPYMHINTARFLMLEENQFSQINAALSRAQSALNKLQRQHAEIISQSETELKLRVRPFPEEGEQVWQTLNHELNSAIDDDSKTWIIELIYKSLQETFRHFGAKERILTGRTTQDGYNEVTEDGITRGFPFKMSFDSMQQNLFHFEETK